MLLSSLLQGGLTQPKMLAALELFCDATSTAADTGLAGSVPGIDPAQSVCARWRLRPIRNLVGNQGRHIFVSDSTRQVARFESAALTKASLLAGVKDDLRALVKYGLLESTMRPPQPFSEAHELRMLKVDVRFEPVELCILTKLRQGSDASRAYAECQSEAQLYPTEKTYDLADVFDEEIAARSLREYAPASWAFTYVDFPFVNALDPTPAPVQSALLKAFLRDFLNRPTITNPATGLPVTIEHPPLYRKLHLLDRHNQFVELIVQLGEGVRDLPDPGPVHGRPAGRARHLRRGLARRAAQGHTALSRLGPASRPSRRLLPHPRAPRAHGRELGRRVLEPERSLRAGHVHLRRRRLVDDGVRQRRRHADGARLHPERAPVLPREVPGPRRKGAVGGLPDGTVKKTVMPLLAGPWSWGRPSGATSFARRTRPSAPWPVST